MKQKHIWKSAGVLLTVAAISILTWNHPCSAAKTLSFSKNSGFYSKSFSLTLSTGNKGDKIYYTTDGSVPDKTSTLYKNPIKIKDRSSQKNQLANQSDIAFFADYTPTKPVAKGTVIRAVAYNKSGKKSDVITNSYFIGNQFLKKYKNIPVVSIAIDPDDLFDKKTGLYVKGDAFDKWVAEGNDPTGENVWDFQANFTQEGRDWERPVCMNFFENSTKSGFTQDLGMRLVGGFSRDVPQKSFKFFARKDYGKKRVKYNLFPGNTIESDHKTALSKYKTFVLRNGGNDTWTTKFRNYFVESLVTDRAFDTHAARPAIAFVDGEYWGIYTMQEDYSDTYIEDNYNIDEDNVIMIKIGTLEEGTDDDMKLYEDLIDFAKNTDLSKEENYQKICNSVDIQSAADYFATEIWMVNRDWLNNDNNYRMWRARIKNAKNPYADTKWRYMLYDVEFSMGAFYTPDDATLDSLTAALIYPEEGVDGDQVTMLRSLLSNKNFKQKFVTTFMDLVNVNFNASHTRKQLDMISSQYRPYMKDYYDRFGTFPMVSSSKAVKNFDAEVKDMKTFLTKRNLYIPKMLKEDLDLDGTAVPVTIRVNSHKAGTVSVNTVNPDFSSGSFTGSYFTDYPITLTAKPKKGYQFKGWSGAISSTDKTISLSFSKACSIKAVFEKK